MRKFTIGSRGSDLALWQANHLKNIFHQDGIKSEIEIIKTKGDRVQDLGFSKMEGKGFFTKEIERALIDQSIDVAVHSYKDLPTESPPGLIIAANSERGNPFDWLVIQRSASTSEKHFHLPEGAIIGTSSSRRKAQIKQLRPDVEVRDIRGNVPSRLKKLKEGPFHANIMAAAGLLRLEIDQQKYDVYKFTPEEFVPAPAQGVLAFQCRTDDEDIRTILEEIHRSEVHDCISAERFVLKAMGGGCHLPLGVYCTKENDEFHLLCNWAPDALATPKRIDLSGPSAQQLAEQAVFTLKEFS